MEIVIDEAFVREILKQEYGQTRDEILSSNTMVALQRSQPRHDARIASAPDFATLDCRAGCAWCCHFSIDVRAVEAFGIVDFIERNFTAEEKARVRGEVRANSLALEGLDEIDRMRRNVKCPMLHAGRCTIYDVRPQTCRNYHATDVTGCERSYNDPDDLDIDPDFAPFVYQAGAAHVEAFSGALRDAGHDTNAYELNAALQAAWSDPAARSRFEARSAPFIDLPGEDVPAEFDDVERG